jgi:hypothetical protein
MRFCRPRKKVKMREPVALGISFVGDLQPELGNAAVVCYFEMFLEDISHTAR